MRLLLDTHVVIWSSGAPERIAAVRPALDDSANDLVVSAVVAWEIAIKHGLGRLPLPVPPALFVAETVRDLGAQDLAISHAHALGVGDLPPIHGDPFDRMLVAQAIALDATLVTGDARLADYPCATLLV